MLGRKTRDQLELFITGSLEQLVPRITFWRAWTAFSISAGCARRELIEKRFAAVPVHGS